MFQPFLKGESVHLHLPYMSPNILIVNQNIDEAKQIKTRLASSNTNAVCAFTIDEALDAFSKMEFCLVILDSAISASDDHNILKAMRSAKTMPILVLSSHADHTERIHAFQAGAHAYMGKPYTEEECLAQAHTLMQLYIDMNPQRDGLCYTLAFGKDLVIEPDTRRVVLQGRELKLTRKEYDLLFWLASNPGKVYSCGQLYDHVWDEFAIGNVDDVVKYHIKSLRKKLTLSSAEYIKNVWGVGYKFANAAEVTV